MSLLGLSDIIRDSMNNNANWNLTMQQLKKQSQENEKARQYNLDLAKKQNEWNIAQWNRENEYNSPVAQKARLQAAGLNADMMYGGSGVMNTAASSPQMTSGAPASPMDWSSMANAVPRFSSIDPVGELLDYKIKKEQLKGLEEDNQSKDIHNRYLETEKQLGLNISMQTYRRNESEFELLKETIDQAKITTQQKGLDYMRGQIEYAFRAEECQTLLKKLSNELKVSNYEVKLMVESYAYRLTGLEMDAKLKDADVKWNDPAVIDKLGGSNTATLLKVLMMLLK